MSCHNLSEANMASCLSITSSPFPPFGDLSNSARAIKPLGLTFGGGAGCGVKFPNNSAPLSIVPLPLRSSARKASSDPDAVHDKCSAVPLLSRSKSTPPGTLVRLNPSPKMSTRTGVCGPMAWLQSQKAVTCPSESWQSWTVKAGQHVPASPHSVPKQHSSELLQGEYVLPQGGVPFEQGLATRAGCGLVQLTVTPLKVPLHAAVEISDLKSGCRADIPISSSL
jgi:hypothetical protein